MIASNHFNLGRKKEEFSFELLMIGWSCWHLDFRLLASKMCENKFVLYASEFMVICSSSLAAAVAIAKPLQSCPTLCDPIDGSPPGSPVPGILQARTLEWVATSFSNACMHARLLQSCSTLCNPMDSSPPGSSVHRILLTRILEWVAISFCIT